MFGFGFKSKVKKIVEDELECFVTPMFAGRFSNVVKEGKIRGTNEYTVAIDFVLQITEHLESVWSEETGKVESEEIILRIKERCDNLNKVLKLSDAFQDEHSKQIQDLISKVSWETISNGNNKKINEIN